MNIQYITASFLYVTGDRLFWLSMALTFIIGMFIASSIYNGEVKEIKKLIIGLGSYAVLIMMTSGARVFPQIMGSEPGQYAGYPFAGIITVLLVSFFYGLGMMWGIRVTYQAHKHARGVK